MSSVVSTDSRPAQPFDDAAVNTPVIEEKKSNLVSNGEVKQSLANATHIRHEYEFETCDNISESNGGNPPDITNKNQYGSQEASTDDTCFAGTDSMKEITMNNGERKRKLSANNNEFICIKKEKLEEDEISNCWEIKTEVGETSGLFNFCVNKLKNIEDIEVIDLEQENDSQIKILYENSEIQKKSANEIKFVDVKNNIEGDKIDVKQETLKSCAILQNAESHSAAVGSKNKKKKKKKKKKTNLVVSDNDNAKFKGLNSNGSLHTQSSLEVKEDTAKVCDDLEFISEDPTENLDNSHPKWKKLKLLYEKGGNFKEIRQKWGNLPLPEPSLNLTFRQYNMVDRHKTVWDKKAPPQPKKTKIRRRSRSCVSHFERMVNAARNETKKQLSDLISRQNLELLNIDLVNRMVTQKVNRWYRPEINAFFKSQNLSRMEMLGKFQRNANDIVNKGMSRVDLYEKCIAEARSFHARYEIDGDPTLTNEQYEHLHETERMYEEYKKFYK